MSERNKKDKDKTGILNRIGNTGKKAGKALATAGEAASRRLGKSKNKNIEIEAADETEKKPSDFFDPWHKEEPVQAEEEAKEDEAEAGEADENEEVIEKIEVTPEPEQAEIDEAKAGKGWFNAKKKRIAWAAGILGILILGSAGAYAAVADETTFAKNVIVNNVDVSGMNVDEASAAFNANLNDWQIECDDEGENNVHTSFMYSNAGGIDRLIKFSHLDPRGKLGSGKKTYKLGLDTTAGIEETAATLGNIYPLAEGETMTQDAHIDYDNMSIVDAVQGSNIDWKMLAEAISAQRKTSPTKSTYKFAKEDFVDVPDVVAEDLADELEFAKEYLAKGLDVELPSGEVVHANARQLSKVILYDESGADYSKEGATELAEELARSYRSDIVKVMTQEGERSLYNYALAGAIDVEKSADSILEAAKKGEKGKLFADDTKTTTVGDHVEVSISTQTVYLVQNGEVTLASPVVTGTFGHETPKGVYKLAWKASPATLKGKNDDGTDYSEPVSFWMPFNGGIGLHDAPWRAAFGGSIYRGNGSHGCVNLPYNTARRIYNAVSSGYIIMVY